MGRIHKLLAASRRLAFVGLAISVPLAFGQIRTPTRGEMPFNPGPAGPHTNQDDCPTPFVDPQPPDEVGFGGVIYVDQHAVASANTGRCWRHAYVDLRWALLDAAQRTGPVEIWVARGVYRPDGGTRDPARAFELLDSVAIYGGFSGRERSRSQRNPDPRTNGTALSGLLDATVNPPLRSAHVVVSIANSRSAVLDGFSIVQGFAGGPGAPGSAHGGGAQLLSSQALLRNCRFSANDATGLGGALYVDGGAPLLRACIFEGNHAGQRGGAVAAVGPARIGLTDCTFFANSTNGDGGAIDIADFAGGPLNICRFVANVAGGSGGAIHFGGSSTPLVANSLFDANAATLGGAIAFAQQGSGLLLNCTLAANRAVLGYGVAFATPAAVAVRNTILWGNTDLFGLSGPQFHTNQDAGDPDIAYSLVQGWTGGVGNLAGNPRFRDPDGLDNIAGTLDDDLRLSGISPCIDAGANTAWPDDGIVGTLPPFDLDQLPRFHDDLLTPDTGIGPPPVVDMGAYEFRRAAPSGPP